MVLLTQSNMMLAASSGFKDHEADLYYHDWFRVNFTCHSPNDEERDLIAQCEQQRASQEGKSVIEHYNDPIIKVAHVYLADCDVSMNSGFNSEMNELVAIKDLDVPNDILETIKVCQNNGVLNSIIPDGPIDNNFYSRIIMGEAVHSWIKEGIISRRFTNKGLPISEALIHYYDIKVTTVIVDNKVIPVGRYIETGILLNSDVEQREIHLNLVKSAMNSKNGRDSGEKSQSGRRHSMNSRGGNPKENSDERI